MLTTIGYEQASLENFIATLQSQDIEILVDVRDRAQSRRKGFSKTALSNALADAGIQYLHIKALGDPKEGREAARAGKYDEFRKIFGAVLVSAVAKEALLQVQSLVENRNVCLMCYERDPHTCHRKMVSDVLEVSMDLKAIHIGVRNDAHQIRSTG